MGDYSHLEACAAVAEILEGYMEDKEIAAGVIDANALAITIESALYGRFVEPAVDFWKCRLGSEIQDLRLRECLLSCHLRLYIANFGAPPLENLVNGAKERGKKPDMA